MNLNSPRYPRNPYSWRARIVLALEYFALLAAGFIVGMLAATTI